MPLIEVRNAVKTYQMGDETFYALHGVSFSIEKGEFVAIMGASGSGKSTCMNMLGALDKPTSGEYYLDGVDVFSLNSDELSDIRNNKIGFVFQGFNLISRTSAIDNVALPMIYKGIAEEERYKRAKEALKIVGLDSKENNMPSQMSGGQQQRVAIARAIVNDAPLILADEPTGNLDTKTSIDVMEFFVNLNEKLNKTIVLVTHEPDIAEYTKRIIKFKDGKIVSDLLKEDWLKQKQEKHKYMIDFKSTFKIAINSLKVNKMRSALTSLGIIIGVAAVIVMLAIGSGANKQVQENMESMGSNLLTIRSATAKTGGVSMGIGSKPTLSLKDAAAIQKQARGIEAVAPVVNSTSQLMYGNQNWQTTVYGVTNSYLYIKNYEIELGHSFSINDNLNAAKVALIGSTVETELFGDVNPIGKTIRVGNVPFKVIGTLKTKGQQGPMDQDDLILIPVTTAQRKLFGTDFPGSVNQIVAKAKSLEDSNIAQSDIEEILRTRHNLGKTQEDDFKIRNSAEFQERMKSTVQTFAILLASIASVSLVVGGIGIMNIMLVSVTERTKEIGIRMAIGARAHDIRIQFLIEALVLSLIGGIIGIIAGIIIALLVGVIFNTKILITIPPILLSFCFSGLVGIGFGYYPAHKASLLNPIDALRYE